MFEGVSLYCGFCGVNIWCFVVEEGKYDINMLGQTQSYPHKFSTLRQNSRGRDLRELSVSLATFCWSYCYVVEDLNVCGSKSLRPAVYRSIFQENEGRIKGNFLGEVGEFMRGSGNFYKNHPSRKEREWAAAFAQRSTEYCGAIFFESNQLYRHNHRHFHRQLKFARVHHGGTKKVNRTAVSQK